MSGKITPPSNPGGPKGLPKPGDMKGAQADPIKTTSPAASAGGQTMPPSIGKPPVSSGGGAATPGQNPMATIGKAGQRSAPAGAAGEGQAGTAGPRKQAPRGKDTTPTKQSDGAKSAASEQAGGKTKSESEQSTQEKAEPTLAPGGNAALEQDSAPAAGKGAKAAAAGVAAAPAGLALSNYLVISAFLNYLKSILAAAMAVAQNAVSSFFGVFATIGKTLLTGVTAVGSWVGSIVGGGVNALVAGATTVGAVLMAAVVVVAMAVTGLSSGNVAGQGLLIPCADNMMRAVGKVNQSGDPVSIDGMTLANAQKVYGVLAAWGMPKENIAGILGNWEAESGIDPTRVQNVPNAPHELSETEAQGAMTLDNGIGLGQWTFGRNAKLREYSDRVGVDWWTIEAQLGFMVSADEGGNAEIVKGMIADSKGSPTAAALYFHDEWERSADTAEMAQRRGAYANKWMGLMAGWGKNQALASSILAQAGTTVTAANAARVKTVLDNCKTGKNSTVLLRSGGLTLEEAQEFVAEYRAVGKALLDDRYPGETGPGGCRYNDKSDNCVGMSMYFLHKYTSLDEQIRFEQTRQWVGGNGIDVAPNVAAALGRETTNVPSPYSVASGPGSGAEGHTFVVVGIEGTNAVIVEAACSSGHTLTRARTMPLSTLTDGSHTFVDVSDMLLDQPLT